MIAFLLEGGIATIRKVDFGSGSGGSGKNHLASKTLMRSLPGIAQEQRRYDERNEKSDEKKRIECD